MAKINSLRRIFKFNGKILEDPAPDLEPKEVVERIFSKMYPSLTNGTVEGPFAEGETETYKLESFKVRSNYGTKG